MSAEKFSIGEALGFGWNTMLSKLLPVLGFGLLAGLILLGPGFLIGIARGLLGLNIHENGLVMNLIVTPVQLVVSAIASMGLIKILLMFCDGKDPSPGDFFSNMSSMLNFIGGQLLYSLVVMVGMCLLVVPGIIWAIQFMFTPYAIVDEALGPIEAMKRSSQLTQGCKWQLLGFSLLGGLLNIAGLICLIIGIIPAAIVFNLATAYVYRSCQRGTQAPGLVS